MAERQRFTVEDLLSAKRGAKFVPSSVTEWFHGAVWGETLTGAFATKEEARADANATYDPGEGYSIHTGHRWNLLDYLTAEKFFEEVSEEEELSWMEDSFDSWAGITADQLKDLDERLRRTVAEWIVAKDVHMPAVCDHDSNETVPAALPTDGEGK